MIFNRMRCIDAAIERFKVSAARAYHQRADGQLFAGCPRMNSL